MGRLVVQAAMWPTEQRGRLVVSVSGNEDGVPRSGLTPESFEVVAMLAGEEAMTLPCRVDQALEGPAGIYQLMLGCPEPSWPMRAIWSIAVTGDIESGWADQRGQSLVLTNP